MQSLKNCVQCFSGGLTRELPEIVPPLTALRTQTSQRVKSARDVTAKTRAFLSGWAESKSPTSCYTSHSNGPMYKTGQAIEEACWCKLDAFVGRAAIDEEVSWVSVEVRRLRSKGVVLIGVKSVCHVTTQQPAYVPVEGGLLDETEHFASLLALGASVLAQVEVCELTCCILVGEDWTCTLTAFH